jgi:hypothetical protein
MIPHAQSAMREMLKMVKLSTNPISISPPPVDDARVQTSGKAATATLRVTSILFESVRAA